MVHEGQVHDVDADELRDRRDRRVAEDAYNKLSADDKKTRSRRSARRTSKKLRKVIRKANDDAKATMTQQGRHDHADAGPMVDDFTKQSQEMWKELIGKIYSKDELRHGHQVSRRVPREAQVAVVFGALRLKGPHAPTTIAR